MTKLQEIRKAKGMSQSQLANKAGLNVRMLQHYEQGTRSINGAAGMTLYRISEVLDCEIKDLLEFGE